MRGWLGGGVGARVDPEPELASASPVPLWANGRLDPTLAASACLTNMLIRVQIFTHLISRSRGCFSLIGVGGAARVYFSMVDLNMAWRWWGGIVNYCRQMNFSPPFSCGGRGENGGVDQIRLSLGGERFHLEHEVIALIEVAFITLTYYMSKWASAPSRRRYGNIVTAPPQ